MNERIRELMEQVVRVEIDPDSNCETIYTCGPEEFLGFAELLIQECDSIIEKYSKANMESDSWVAMISMMQKELKQHFGVEE